jgi:hypothetical protein
MSTRAEDMDRALTDSITREQEACLRVQRLTLAFLTLSAGVVGYAAGSYTTYRLLKRRER